MVNFECPQKKKKKVNFDMHFGFWNEEEEICFVLISPPPPLTVMNLWYCCIRLLFSFLKEMLLFLFL